MDLDKKKILLFVEYLPTKHCDKYFAHNKRLHFNLRYIHGRSEWLNVNARKK